MQKIISQVRTKENSILDLSNQIKIKNDEILNLREQVKELRKYETEASKLE